MKCTSAIVAIARDENPYILEWLAYHIAIGVDHIFLYDHNSHVPLASMLSATKSWRRITVIQWKDRLRGNAQLEAYAHFLRTFGHAYEWVAVIDADEFISLPQHERINDFLAGFAHANSVAINWRYFGSSGQEKFEPGLVMERFTRASHIHSGVNTGIKSIYRTADVAILMHHYSEMKSGRKVFSADGTPITDSKYSELAISETNFALAQINHYFCKSKEEWDRKVSRGYSWTDEDRSPYFRLADQNDVEEKTILRWKNRTEHLIKEIKARDGLLAIADAAAKPLLDKIKKIINA